METPPPSRPAAPAVVAVVVTRDPGPWFETALGALAAQDYPNLAVLFIDAASETDPTPRIAAALPGAYVRRLEPDRAAAGYGACANVVGEVVDGAAFYCFLHDDAAPAPDAISTMVDEAVRSNAGIVGPKLTRLDDHRRILQVGESVDKTGERLPAVEPGELDQEQHDAVRDTFVVPGACTLVRADLFAAIGGFDEGIDLLDDDLNLCWRAHLAGARVLVAPDAVVGHAEALGERSDPDQRRHRLLRHRLRTILSCYSGWHLLRVLPQAALVAVAEVVYSLAVGRRGQAGDVAGAWRWNWRRRDEIRAWRARVAAFRTVPDVEIRRLQTRGSARLTRFVRGQTSRGGSRSDRAQAAWRDLADAVRGGELRWPIAAWLVTAVIVAFGSRHLVLRPIAAVGGFPAFDASPGQLWAAYLSGWRDVGLGQAAPSPTAFALLAGAGATVLGAMGTLRRILLLGSVVLGLVGAYRLLRPAGSARARAASLVVYGAIPLAYDAVADARWGSLTVYAAAPWLLAQLARAAGWAPFGERGADGQAGTGDVVRPHRTLPRIAAIGVLLAVVGAVTPAVVPVALLVLAALALGSAVAGRPGGVARLLVCGLGGVGVAVALHVPWALELVLPGATWAQVVGRSGAGEALGLVDLFRFDVGPVGGSALAIGFPLAGALPLLIGRGWRFDWAVRAWAVVLACIAWTWADGRGWLPLDAPPPETVLAPAAAAMAMAVGLGVVAFEVDLRAYGFGWRQVASGLAAVALLVGAVPTLLDAGNGRWYLPAGGLDSTFGFLEGEPDGYRVLWIGDPDVLPLAGPTLDLDGVDGAVFATSGDGLPGITDGWPGSLDGATQLLEDALGLAVDGETERLGRLLAPMAVRYVVIPTASAPRPLGGVQRPAPEVVLDALADQLDLAALPVNPAYVVYRNEAALPARVALAPGAGERGTFDVVADDVTGARPVLEERAGRTRWTGTIEAGSRVLHSATADDGWELLVDGRPVPSTKAFGWAQAFEPDVGGEAVLRYDTSPLRYGVVAFQALFWLLAVRFALRARRRAEVAPVLAAPVPAAAPWSDESLAARPEPAPRPPLVEADIFGAAPVGGGDDDPLDAGPDWAPAGPEAPAVPDDPGPDDDPAAPTEEDRS